MYALTLPARMSTLTLSLPPLMDEYSLLTDNIHALPPVNILEMIEYFHCQNTILEGNIRLKHRLNDNQLKIDLYALLLDMDKDTDIDTIILGIDSDDHRDNHGDVLPPTPPNDN